MPVLCLDPLSIHSQHVLLHKLCSLHVKNVQSIWTRRFGEVNEDHLYVIIVEKVLQSQGLGEVR